MQGIEGFLLNGTPGHIAWNVTPDLLFPLAVLWISCWSAGVLLRRPQAILPLFADLLAARVLWLVLSVLVQLPVMTLPGQPAPPERPALEAAIDHALDGLALWWLLAALVRIARVLPSDQRAGKTRLLLAWGAFAGPALALMLLYPTNDLWQADDNPADGEPTIEAMREEVFYNQPNLLEDALDRVQAERPGVDDLYFLGFAGDANTPAIRNEVDLADRLLAERFDTGGRNLVLANDAGPAPQRPFATRTALSAALQRFADVMDVEDDILLLFLSSHGSSANTLVLSQPALALGDLDPAGLRSALDQSGIRWRIVIVSACYSGGFVDALRNDQTLVITASDATHPSFGCGVADRYTWFGQAFFDEALRHTQSFPQAFELARKRIAAREQATGETPSNPQMALGRAMAAKLLRLQARLRQPGGPGGSVQARWPAPGRGNQAGMSGVSEHSRAKISSFRRSLRFFSRRRATSSTSPPSP